MRLSLAAVRTGIDRFNGILGWFLAFTLLVMTVLIFWQFFARFVIGKPLYFSEEIARFCMIWLTFLGAGLAFRKGLLISIDIALEHAGPVLGKMIRILIILSSICFAFILTYFGFDIVDRVSHQTAPSTRISMMWPYIAVPLGGIVIIINSIDLLLKECVSEECALQELAHKEPESEEA
uniref:TRAP transporter small permease n=1 Tax=Halomonas sp. TaxID=1486246 RepID=UPI0026301210|nr:TRAP transporter small permease [Halomonas sp.]